MIPIGEFDRELLELFLDDALSPGQVEHVLQRLADEPALADAMRELRAQRNLRLAAWRAMEPPEQRAAEVAGRVARAIRRAERRRRAWGVVRLASAVAAALAVFVAGWFIRGNGSSGVLAQTREPAGADVRVYPLAASGGAAASKVALTDESGHVLAVQKFDRPDEARDFANDLVRYEARRRDVGRGRAAPASAQF